MDYKELVAIQEKIEKYRKDLRQIISNVDEDGHRKLNPIFFLSAEVAAYKILNIWHKKMMKGEDIFDDSFSFTLGDIETMFEYREGDFSDDAVRESYEESNQLLWYDLFDYSYDMSLKTINKEIIGLYNILLIATSREGEEKEYWCINDDAEMGIIYTEAHDMIMSLEPQLLEAMLMVFEQTKIYKLHFDIFQ